MTLPRLCPLQLGEFFDELLQSELGELYRNLRVVPFAFALVDGAYAVFGMADALARTEAALAARLGGGNFRHGEFFPARGEELGDVVDGVVGCGWLAAAPGRGRPGSSC